MDIASILALSSLEFTPHQICEGQLCNSYVSVWSDDQKWMIMFKGMIYVLPLSKSSLKSYSRITFSSFDIFFFLFTTYRWQKTFHKPAPNFPSYNLCENLSCCCNYYCWTVYTHWKTSFHTIRHNDHFVLRFLPLHIQGRVGGKGESKQGGWVSR